MTVTGSVDFALDDDALLTVMAGDEQSQKGSDEEENNVPEASVSASITVMVPKYLHDSKSPGSLEHGTLTVDLQAPSVSSDGEQAQVGAVDSPSTPVGAVCVSDASERIDCTDEGADEQKVDKGNKLGRVPCACVEKESSHDPCCSEHRYDEENQDGGWCEKLARVVPIDEPGQHAQRGYEGDELEDAPENEGQAGEGHDGGWCGQKLLRGKRRLSQ